MQSLSGVNYTVAFLGLNTRFELTGPGDASFLKPDERKAAQNEEGKQEEARLPWDSNRTSGCFKTSGTTLPQNGFKET